jgi:hypothetical protein
MADLLPLNFPLPSESSIASYDYIDSIEGLGYITFYAVNHTDFTIAHREAIASQRPTISFGFTNPPAILTKLVDKDWDLSFNKTHTVGGADVYTNATIQTQTASGGIKTFRMDVLIYKIAVGGAATLLVTGTGAVINIGAATLASARLLTKAVLPVTVLKKGEKLRFNTEIYAVTDTAAATDCYLYCDGANRSSSARNQIDPDASTTTLGYTNRTDITFTVPFKLNL